jgi:hypothetical protein
MVKFISVMGLDCIFVLFKGTAEKLSLDGYEWTDVD